MASGYSSIEYFGSGSMSYRAYLSVSTTTSSTTVTISYTAKVQMRYACYYGVKIAVSGGNSKTGYLTSDPGSSWKTVATTTGSFSVARGTSDSTKTVKATASGATVNGVGAADNDSVSVSLKVSIPKKPSYSVSYNANGGSGAPSSQTKWYGSNLTLSSVKPTRSGYIFKGWNTSSTATTASYQPGASYTINSSITLYAVWELTYDQPAVSDLTVARCLSDGTDSLVGEYFKVSFSYTLDSGLTLSSGTISCGDASASIDAGGSTGTVTKIFGGSFKPLQSYTITVSLTDTAPLTKAFSTTVSPITYSPPTISSFSAIRCTSEGVEDTEGTYGQITIVWSIDPLTDNSNSCQNVFVKYRENGSTAASINGVVSGTTTGANGTAISIISGLDVAKTYNVYIVVQDNVTSTNNTTTITPSFFTIDLLNGGKGIAFGKAATNEGFECDMDAQFDRNVDITGDATCGGYFTSLVKTPNQTNGYYTDEYGNFIYCGSEAGDYFNVRNSSNTIVFKLVYESGALTGNIHNNFTTAIASSSSFTTNAGTSGTGKVNVPKKSGYTCIGAVSLSSGHVNSAITRVTPNYDSHNSLTSVDISRFNTNNSNSNTSSVSARFLYVRSSM